MARSICRRIATVEEDIVMSLLDEYISMTGGCVMIDRQTVSDGLGGVKVNYVEGAEFDAAITLSNSIQAQIAEKQGVTGLYRVTTSRSINLQYHEVFKRKSDGKIFRVTSDGDDEHTPPSSTLDMRQVTAEEYTLPISNNNQ